MTRTSDEWPSPEEWAFIEWQNDPEAQERDPDRYILTAQGWIAWAPATDGAPRGPKRKPALDWIAETIDGLPATLTVDEARAALRMSRRNFYRLTATGRIRARRAVEAGSSRLLIPRAELARYLRDL